MVALVVWFAASVVGAGAGETPASHWWGREVEASLDRAPGRKEAWESVLAKAPAEQRAGIAYLVRYLPLRDLKNLAPETLAANVALAYQARAEVPWGPKLPEDVFLDAVLPHANVTEPRDSMRAEFHKKYLPLVKGCATPGEAARRLNEAVFRDYKVRYNTKRLRTDQNSRESISQGMATCTGLSIMLAEACRAVAVPARLAGIHSWPGRGGNHTWAEVWDGGSWHFVGAAEPDPNGLDRAWFAGEATGALKDKPLNAIFAVTYRETGDHFPLAWDEDAKVNAENVTDRYTRGRSSAPARPRLMVEVLRAGERVEAEVSALDRTSGATVLSGKSLGPRADINLHLNAPATAGEPVLVVARLGGAAAVCRATVGDADTVVRISLDKPDARADLSAVLADRFGADDAKREVARKLLAEVPPEAESRASAWSAFKASPRHESLRKEFEAKTVSTADRKSAYKWRHVGNKPKGGWPLVIAMHGGGGVPKEINDEQWGRMFERYYKDNPEAGGYTFLALRAPNDAWNGFYDDAIAPLVERLIEQFVLFGEVDPDKVSITGASHGGYGAFVIGPKIADRFAAVHASAAAPTPGETRGENLRDTRFTFMVGENDTDHGRRDRCLEFAKQMQDWRAKFGGYPGVFEWLPGVGHTVPGRNKPAEMVTLATRNPWPNRVVWSQSDGVLKHFYWVEALRPADNGFVDVSVKDNTLKVKAERQDTLAFWLDAPLVDLTRPVVIEVAGGKTTTVTPRPSLETYCVGLEHRADPRLAAPARVEVALKP
jgi:transglutaminase-like putative cysteine protease/poly(3-hydroxybutyrate) depolymerase